MYILSKSYVFIIQLMKSDCERKDIMPVPTEIDGQEYVTQIEARTLLGRGKPIDRKTFESNYKDLLMPHTDPRDKRVILYSRADLEPYINAQIRPATPEELDRHKKKRAD